MKWGPGDYNIKPQYNGNLYYKCIQCYSVVPDKQLTPMVSQQDTKSTNIYLSRIIKKMPHEQYFTFISKFQLLASITTCQGNFCVLFRDK